MTYPNNADSVCHDEDVDRIDQKNIDVWPKEISNVYV